MKFTMIETTKPITQTIDNTTNAIATRLRTQSVCPNAGLQCREEQLRRCCVGVPLDARFTGSASAASRTAHPRGPDHPVAEAISPNKRDNHLLRSIARARIRACDDAGVAFKSPLATVFVSDSHTAGLNGSGPTAHQAQGSPTSLP
jgi:hypothetical protein